MRLFRRKQKLADKGSELFALMGAGLVTTNLELRAETLHRQRLERDMAALDAIVRSLRFRPEMDLMVLSGKDVAMIQPPEVREKAQAILRQIRKNGNGD